MEWKNRLSKTPILVLFVILISVGVGTASALITITLAGDVTITGDTTLQGDLTCNNCVDSGDLGFGAVESLNINNDAVQGVHIRENAVGSDEIADGTITKADLNSNIFSPVTVYVAQQLTGQGNTDVTMTPVATSFCALSQVSLQGDDEACFITTINGNWVVRAHAFTETGFLECRANCFSWQ